MSMIPTRLLALQRLQALFENEPLVVMNRIQAVSLEGSVLRGRNLIGEDAPTDEGFLLSFIEAPRPDVAFFAGEENSHRSDNWTILLQGLCDDEKMKPGDNAYWFYAAVEERLARVLEIKPGSGSPRYPEHYRLGDLIGNLEIAPPVIRPPGDKPTAKAFFFLPIRLAIATKLGQPYTSVT